MICIGEVGVDSCRSVVAVLNSLNIRESSEGP